MKTHTLVGCVQTDEVPSTVPVALFSGSLRRARPQGRAAGADGVELMTVDPSPGRGRRAGHALAPTAWRPPPIGSGAIAFATGMTLLHPEPAKAAHAAQRLDDLIDFAAAIGAPIVTIGSFRGRLATAGRMRPPDWRNPEAGRRTRRARPACAWRWNRSTATSSISSTPASQVWISSKRWASPPWACCSTPSTSISKKARGPHPSRRRWQAGRLWHVHLGDNNRLPPGQGLIDFAAILRVLRAGGYTGYLSAELLARPDGDTGRRSNRSPTCARSWRGTMQLSCLPVSFFADIIAGRMTVPEWAAMGAGRGLDGIDLSILFVPDRSPAAVAELRREIEARHARDHGHQLPRLHPPGRRPARSASWSWRKRS